MSRPRLAPLFLLLSLAGPSCAHDTAPLAIPPPGPSAPLLVDEGGDDFLDDKPSIPEVEGDDTVRAIVRLGHTDSHVTDHLRHLTEQIGPRLTGSHRMMQAETWCRDQLASWGLDARLERWGQFPVGFDRGPWSGGMVAPETIAYDFVTPAWTPGIFEAVEGPAVAYPRSRAEAKKVKAGTWVVRPKELDLPSKVIEGIDEELAKAKVLGVIRADRDPEGKLVHTHGRSQIEWGKLSELVSITLRGDQHDDLTARMGKGEEVRLAFSIDNRFFRGPVPQHNVVADLVGSELPNEYVIIGGHLDSWDGATGANDNGTGVATSMEAMRLLEAAGARPRRTIRVVLWSGEEQGLLGSNGYVETHAEEMDEVSAVFVHDGGTNYLSGLGVTQEMRPQLEPALAPLQQLAPDTMPFVLRDAQSLEPGGSDHTPFIRAGVPGFFWDQAGRSEYDHVHHTQFDTLDNAIEEYQRHSAMVVAITAYQVANLPERLDRTNSAPIPRRRMGVGFSGELTVDEVEKDGVAAKAGWKTGDKIVSVDGKDVEGMRDVMRAVRDGEPKKTVVIERKGKRITTTLDWSGTEGERERAARVEARKAKQ